MAEQQLEQQPKPEISSKPPLEKEPKESKIEIEKELAALEKEISTEEKITQKQPLYPPSPPPPIVPKQPKTETRKKIEKILSEDLVDIYQAMDAGQRSLFKQKGEETASAIEALIQTAKATAKKIIRLIREWLKLIPGVNKFFLEQETKIKTDKILAIDKKRDN